MRREGTKWKRHWNCCLRHSRFSESLKFNEEGKVMEIIQRILEAYFEYVRFILEHLFWFIPK